MLAVASAVGPSLGVSWLLPVLLFGRLYDFYLLACASFTHTHDIRTPMATSAFLARQDPCTNTLRIWLTKASYLGALGNFMAVKDAKSR